MMYDSILRHTGRLEEKKSEQKNDKIKYFYFMNYS